MRAGVILAGVILAGVILAVVIRQGAGGFDFRGAIVARRQLYAAWEGSARSAAAKSESG